MNGNEGTVPESPSNPSTGEEMNITNTADVFDLSKYDSPPSRNGTSVNIYDKALCENNQPLIKFINKCIFLDPTIEMESIIRKVLLPAFVKADKEYKNSPKFHRVITKAFQRLQNEPQKKYSCINDVHETLKWHSAYSNAPPKKKRVEFVTLSTTVSEPNRAGKKRAGNGKICDANPKKSKHEVIALDCEEDDDVIAIDNKPNDSAGSRKIELGKNGVERENNMLVDENETEMIAIDDKVSDDAGSHNVELATNEPELIDNTIPDEHKIEIIAVDDKASDGAGSYDIELATNDPEFENNAVPHENKTGIIGVDDKTSDGAGSYDIELVTNDPEFENNTVPDDDSIEILDSQDVDNIEEMQTDFGNGFLTNVRSVTNSEWESRIDLDKENVGMNLNIQEHSAPVKNKVEELGLIEPLVVPIEYDAADMPSYEVVEHTANKSQVEDPIEIIDSQEFSELSEEQTNAKENYVNNRSIINTFSHNNRKVVKLGKNGLETSESLDCMESRFLVPRTEVVHSEKSPQKNSEAERVEKIKSIEAEIARTKNRIAALEVAEVNNDSAASPYILCDRLQAHVVNLYKDLCALVDADPVKRRKVRLQVSEGHPKGPVKRLERFLNKQVNDVGVAVFPDFSDVVRCVEKSNIKDGLGWSKSIVMSQAQEMFHYCGRALQKRRQRREWKHLRSQVPREVFEDDPADRDPELMAKLEMNRRIAMKKEAEVLDKYTRMESTHNNNTPSPRRLSLQLTEERHRESHESESSSSDEESPTHNTNKNQPQPEEIKEKENNMETCDPNDPIVKIKQEPQEPIKIQYKGDISLVIEISDSESSDDEDGTAQEG